MSPKRRLFCVWCRALLSSAPTYEVRLTAARVHATVCPQHPTKRESEKVREARELVRAITRCPVERFHQQLLEARETVARWDAEDAP